MTMLHTDIKCPICGCIIHVPFMKALETKAMEDYDLAEIDAHTQLQWFKNASLWHLFQYWRRKDA